jgi:hypothetical protein
VIDPFLPLPLYKKTIKLFSNEKKMIFEKARKEFSKKTIKREIMLSVSVLKICLQTLSRITWEGEMKIFSAVYSGIMRIYSQANKFY